MNFKKMLDTSIVVSLFKYFYRWYLKLEQRIGYIFQYSQTCWLLERFLEKIKICIRYSFLGRITEIKEKDTTILNNSYTVRYLIEFCQRWKNKISGYLNASLTAKLTKDTEQQLYFSPVILISIIVASAIFVNTFLSFIFQKEISLWGWLIRVLFLFVSISGLFCQADRSVIKEGSILLKKIQSQYEKD